MKDPRQVLGVSATADVAAVRKRYLQLVHENPPDQAPQRFAEIRAAYDELRDPAARLENTIFEPRQADGDSLDEIIADLREQTRGMRLPVEVLLSLGDS